MTHNDAIRPFAKTLQNLKRAQGETARYRCDCASDGAHQSRTVTPYRAGAAARFRHLGEME